MKEEQIKIAFEAGAEITCILDQMVEDFIVHAKKAGEKVLDEKYYLSDQKIKDGILEQMTIKLSMAKLAIDTLYEMFKEYHQLKHATEYHEDHGDVIWWAIVDHYLEPIYIGQPLNSNWPDDIELKFWSLIGGNRDGRTVEELKIIDRLAIESNLEQPRVTRRYQ